jgi:hypothetical protein
MGSVRWVSGGCGGYAEGGHIRICVVAYESVCFAKPCHVLPLCMLVLTLWDSGPLAWSAPEVLVGTGDSGVVATTATDIYQFGGTLHEIMTCGDAPFWWLLGIPQMLYQRRCTADPMPVPGTTVTVPGLLGRSTLEAASLDREPVTWRVRLVEGSEGSAGRLRELVDILEGCLEEDPCRRWRGNALYVGWPPGFDGCPPVVPACARDIAMYGELCRLEILHEMLVHEVDEHPLQHYCPGEAHKGGGGNGLMWA